MSSAENGQPFSANSEEMKKHAIFESGS